MQNRALGRGPKFEKDYLWLTRKRIRTKWNQGHVHAVITSRSTAATAVAVANVCWELGGVWGGEEFDGKVEICEWDDCTVDLRASLARPASLPSRRRRLKPNRLMQRPRLSSRRAGPSALPSNGTAQAKRQKNQKVEQSRWQVPLSLERPWFDWFVNHQIRTRVRLWTALWLWWGFRFSARTGKCWLLEVSRAIPATHNFPAATAREARVPAKCLYEIPRSKVSPSKQQQQQQGQRKTLRNRAIPAPNRASDDVWAWLHLWTMSKDRGACASFAKQKEITLEKT